MLRREDVVSAVPAHGCFKATPSVAGGGRTSLFSGCAAKVGGSKSSSVEAGVSERVRLTAVSSGKWENYIMVCPNNHELRENVELTDTQLICHSTPAARLLSTD